MAGEGGAAPTAGGLGIWSSGIWTEASGCGLGLGFQLPLVSWVSLPVPRPWFQGEQVLRVNG